MHTTIAQLNIQPVKKKWKERVETFCLFISHHTKNQRQTENLIVKKKTKEASIEFI